MYKPIEELKGELARVTQEYFDRYFEANDPSGLTGPQRERLALIAEEAAEVIQAVGKILRFGYHSTYKAETNRTLLEKEIGDLVAVVALAVDNDDLSVENLDKYSLDKQIRVKPYLKYKHKHDRTETDPS